MKHHWKSQRMGGNPADAESYEYVCFCLSCGDELSEDNRNADDCRGDDRDRPLETVVEEQCLVIRIGIATLAWAARTENGGSLSESEEVDPEKLFEFAKDVAAELSRESETGNSPITDMLDHMIERAADRGSGAIQNKPASLR